MLKILPGDLVRVLISTRRGTPDPTKFNKVIWAGLIGGTEKLLVAFSPGQANLYSDMVFWGDEMVNAVSSYYKENPGATFVYVSAKSESKITGFKGYISSRK